MGKLRLTEVKPAQGHRVDQGEARTRTDAGSYTPGPHQTEPGASWLVPKSALPSKDDVSIIKYASGHDGHSRRSLEMLWDLGPKLETAKVTI